MKRILVFALFMSLILISCDPPRNKRAKVGTNSGTDGSFTGSTSGLTAGFTNTQGTVGEYAGNDPNYAHCGNMTNFQIFPTGQFIGGVAVCRHLTQENEIIVKFQTSDAQAAVLIFPMTKYTYIDPSNNNSDYLGDPVQVAHDSSKIHLIPGIQKNRPGVDDFGTAFSLRPFTTIMVIKNIVSPISGIDAGSAFINCMNAPTVSINPNDPFAPTHRDMECMSFMETFNGYFMTVDIP